MIKTLKEKLEDLYFDAKIYDHEREECNILIEDEDDLKAFLKTYKEQITEILKEI